MRDASAAEGAPAARAEFLRGLSFGWLQSLNGFFAGNNSDLTFAFGILHGIALAVFLPVIGLTQQFRCWHLDQREHLTAFRNPHAVLRSFYPKYAREPRAFHLIIPALNHHQIPNLGHPTII